MVGRVCYCSKQCPLQDLRYEGNYLLRLIFQKNHTNLIIYFSRNKQGFTKYTNRLWRQTWPTFGRSQSQWSTSISPRRWLAAIESVRRLTSRLISSYSIGHLPLEKTYFFRSISTYFSVVENRWLSILSNFLWLRYCSSLFLLKLQQILN